MVQRVLQKLIEMKNLFYRSLNLISFFSQFIIFIITDVTINRSLHSVPSYKKRSYKKRLVDSVRHKKRLYKDTEKIRNTSVQKCLGAEKDV